MYGWQAHLARLVRLLALAATLLIAADTAALAQCDAPAPAGIWENRHAKDQDLTRLEIIHACTKGQHGSYSIIAGTSWTIRAYSRCSPRDCKWGREAAYMDEQGRLVVKFKTFSARRALRITPAGSAISVEMLIDYYGAGRDDVKAEFFLIQAD